MSFSKYFKLPLFAGATQVGDYALKAIIHNANGSIANFPEAKPTGTVTKIFDKSFAASATNIIRLSDGNPALATVGNFEMLRVESATPTDIYVQVCVAANFVDAGSAPILDSFNVRGFESRTIEAAHFAATDIAIAAGEEVWLRFSTMPDTLLEYTPTGADGFFYASKFSQV